MVGRRHDGDEATVARRLTCRRVEMKWCHMVEYAYGVFVGVGGPKSSQIGDPRVDLVPDPTTPTSPKIVSDGWTLVPNL